MANKWLDIGKRMWNQMPDVGKKIVMVVSLFLLGSQFPWETLGEVGTYIKAGLTLGSIFLALKLFSTPEKKTKKKAKEKKAKNQKKNKRKKKVSKLKVIYKTRSKLESGCN